MNLSKKTLLLLGVVVLIVLAAIGFRISQGDDTTAPVTQASPTLPARLVIPKIQVDSQIEHVGVAPDNTMDVPKGPQNAAWYDRGPLPGDTGSAVIDAHFDREGGKPAVFYKLNELKQGDKVSVKDERGTTITFVVRESRKYDPQADAREVFKSSDGKSHLNLITCSGTWNTAEQSYSNRLVVFTDKE